jgi:uncharacterized protein YpuA (DUF1002 family)
MDAIMKAAAGVGAVSAGILWAMAASAQNTIPADPTGKSNEMMRACMEQQDPAMAKDDAVKACRDKMKQGIKIDKPKKPRPKPSEASPGK